MVKRRMSIAIVIAMVMAMLQAVVPAYAAATAIDYVSIDRSNGLNVGNTLEAMPVFTGEADGTEAVTYQWRRLKIESKIAGKESVDAGLFADIEGATGKTYTISKADVGYIIRVAATYNGKTVLSGDCAAVGNILSSYTKPNAPTITLNKYESAATTGGTYVIGNHLGDIKNYIHFINDSNNSDRYLNYPGSVGSGDTSNLAFKTSEMVVAEYALSEAVELEGLLVESGYPNSAQAIPNVFVQVMYENESEYKDWDACTDWGVTYDEAQTNKYKRYFMHYMTGADTDKKVSNIKVIIAPEYDSEYKGNIYVREISAFAHYESGLPEIKAVAGASFDVANVTDVLKGTTAAALLDAITANTYTVSKTIVAADKTTEVAADSYVVDGMYVKLTSAEGDEVFYSTKLAADIFASNFNDYTGKKLYRVNNSPKGSAPSGWTTVYSNNNTDENNVKTYLEGYNDPVKGPAARLVNEFETLTANGNLQLNKNYMDEALTKNKIIAVEANLKVDDILDAGFALQIGGATKTIFYFGSDGIIKVLGERVRSYETNVWYNVLVVLDIAGDNATVYINGDSVRIKKALSLGANTANGVKRINFTYGDFVDGKSVVGSFSFDDIKLYAVTDDSFRGFNKKPADTSRVSLIEASNGIAKVAKTHLENAVLVSDVVSGFDSEYAVSVVNADGTAVASDAAVTEDMKLVFKKAADESALRMFSIKFNDPYIPTFYSGNTEITNITDETAVTAKINIGDAEGVMIVVLYDGDTLKDVVIGTKDDGTLVGEVSLEGIANPEVGVVLVDSFDNITPMLSKMYTITK